MNDDKDEGLRFLKAVLLLGATITLLIAFMATAFTAVEYVDALRTSLEECHARLSRSTTSPAVGRSRTCVTAEPSPNRTTAKTDCTTQGVVMVDLHLVIHENKHDRTVYVATTREAAHVLAAAVALKHGQVELTPENYTELVKLVRTKRYERAAVFYRLHTGYSLTFVPTKNHTMALASAACAEQLQAAATHLSHNP